MNQYKFERGFNIKRFLIASSVVLLVCYGIFNARNLITGPTIEIFSPTSNVETAKNVITVKGRADNVSFISLGGKPIFVNKEGLFEEKMLLSPGINFIEIKARDRFKKEIAKIIKIYYKETATSTTKINL